MKIYLTRLYYRVKDEDQGFVLPYSVVTLNRWATLFQHEDMGNGYGRTIPSQYKYWLMINL